MNEWDHKISAEVKEGPADCIRMAEVRAVLKKMKRHKAPGLSGAGSRNDTSHRGYWNTVIHVMVLQKKEESQRIGNQVWYCQSTKAKVTLWSVDLIEGLNCWNML